MQTLHSETLQTTQDASQDALLSNYQPPSGDALATAQDALASTWQREHNRLVRLAQSIVHNHSTAEDVVMSAITYTLPYALVDPNHTGLLITYTRRLALNVVKAKRKLIDIAVAEHEFAQMSPDEHNRLLVGDILRASSDEVRKVLAVVMESDNILQAAQTLGVHHSLLQRLFHELRRKLGVSKLKHIPTNRVVVADRTGACTSGRLDSLYYAQATAEDKALWA